MPIKLTELAEGHPYYIAAQIVSQCGDQEGFGTIYSSVILDDPRDGKKIPWFARLHVSLLQV